MPRTLWKGAISFGVVNIPVGLYSAENRNSFDLDLLDKRTFTPFVVVMVTLRYANEIRPADNLDVPSSLRITGKELEMGIRLVEGMSGKRNPKEFHDTYHEDLMALIEKRIKAGKTETIENPNLRQSDAKRDG